MFSCFVLHELLSFCFINVLSALPAPLFSHTPGHLSFLVFLRLSLSLSVALTLTHSQHVECLFPELQLLRFLDYYWLSQSFRPCLKSVTVDVVCAASM